ncbi:recombinase family protein [Bradyrhizobium barranii subsp. barranii]|uniref:Recombinase family protein n=1 Tax=Bradyrhizobium barranii subsp. barranii TaxID=2823807 RepID=A0A9X9YCV0_9BRAD|nr:recombinase family protein [Bradyrhizobium barranii subsp. barranii]
MADRDGVYDPGTPNGRLLLGLKGSISELELHTIRSRLTAGLLAKAERGELAVMLPIAPRVTSNSSGCGQSNSSTREAGQGTVSLSLFPGQELQRLL